MEEETIDHEYTSNIVCPHCGYEERDSWEVCGDAGELECGRCRKTFDYERIITVEYTTEKITSDPT